MNRSSRRNFIKTSSALIMAGAANSLFGSNNNIKQISSDGKAVSATDESFWRMVRNQFPLSKDLTYLNNGTMGPSPYSVIEAVHKGMLDGDQYGNYGGWEETAKKIAGFIGAFPEEIALTHNVTDGINIVCWGLPLKKGDEVIMTTHEHVGNAFPWLNRRKLHGIIIKTFTPASTADETLSRIKALITNKTKAFAIPHIPCTQGQILPAKEICALGKEKGIFTFIDGAHGPGMLPLDMINIGADAYASCCHKWMVGPKGTGFLYVRKDFQETLQTLFVGGGSDDAKWNMATTPPAMGNYANNAHRYYGGTQALGLYKGVNASIDFIESIGLMNIHNRIKYLGEYTQNRLLEYKDKIDMLTPTEEKSRCAVIGFRIKGADYAKVYQACADEKIRIRMVAENGLNSLRVSTHMYNNTNDVDRLMNVLLKFI
ncbi:MAG: aminotransferase class V-fold PLP-dependent enzyme [Bacteroidia bacterium]